MRRTVSASSYFRLAAFTPILFPLWCGLIGGLILAIDRSHSRAAGWLLVVFVYGAVYAAPFALFLWAAYYLYKPSRSRDYHGLAAIGPVIVAAIVWTGLAVFGTDLGSDTVATPLRVAEVTLLVGLAYSFVIEAGYWSGRMAGVIGADDFSGQNAISAPQPTR